ncbi:MAG: hypothetical protein JXR52_13045 [Bacteroidales bacterium]|nr:hypothetical protein [Bacteroidales bacterium]MBN2699746.1 hypothetical protein [Bacteroidales bacterium]
MNPINYIRKTEILLMILFSTILQAQNNHDREPYRIPIRDWNLRLVGTDLFYPTYLADPLGIRFEVSSQKMLYSDFDIEDEINSGGDYRGKLVITPGVRFSLFKFSPAGNPKLGVEADLGMIIPVMMRFGNHDLIGTDGIYYFAIAGRPAEWVSLRFSKHHICTHVGDELPTGKVISPVDYDVNTTQLPVRDAFILSAAVRPLWFLKNPQWDILAVYGDFGFFLPGVDFMGTRQNKPHRSAYLNLQGGTELEYYFGNRHLGGIFGALNVSAYQLNAWSPNLSFKAGYIIPQDRFKKRLNIGFNYYNGRSLSNNFYNRKEKFIAFFVAADI